jgi:hypothetical protein
MSKFVNHKLQYGKEEEKENSSRVQGTYEILCQHKTVLIISTLRTLNQTPFRLTPPPLPPAGKTGDNLKVNYVVHDRMYICHYDVTDYYISC